MVAFDVSNLTIFADDSGKTDINVFGDVGKKVEGAFSGTLKSMDGTQPITVKGSLNV